MEQDFLSQDEVDLLLKSLGKEQEEAEGGEEESNVKPFDVNELERISPLRYARLEQIINKWSVYLFPELKSIVINLENVSMESLTHEKLSDFILKIPLPSAIAVLEIEPLEGKFYLIIDPRLLYTIISVVLGGPPKSYKIEGKSFTKVEYRIMKRVLSKMVDTLNRAWQEFVPDSSIKLVDIDDNPRHLITVSKQEMVLLTTMELEIETFKGKFFFVLPMKNLDPIKDTLRNTQVGGEDFKDVVIENLMNTPVLIEALLDRFSMTVREVLEMQEGDLISIDKHISSKIDIVAGGITLFEGILGTFKGKKAVKVRTLKEINAKGDM